MRAEVLLFGGILILGLGLRLLNLGGQSIWIDEAYSLRLATHGPSYILAETLRENHPPLYFLLLSGWLHLGTPSEAWARALSALLGIILVVVLYWFCRETTPHPTPLIASGLMAVSPWAVWHSQDARMYPLALVFAYLGMTIFVRYLNRGGPGWSPVAVCAFLAAALYSHLYAVSALPALLLYLWYARTLFPREHVRRLGVAVIVAGGIWLPWVVLITRVAHTAGFYKPLTVFTLPYTLYAFSVGYTLGPSIPELRQVTSGAGLPVGSFPIVFMVAVLFGIALIAGFWKIHRSVNRFKGLVLLLFGVPIALPLLVTLFDRKIDFNTRYSFLAFPVYLILVAMGLTAFRNRLVKGLFSLGILAMAGTSLIHHYSDPTYAREDTRSAVRLVSSQWQDGDCVLVIGVAPAYQYYEGTPIRSRWLDFRYRDRMEATEAALDHWSRECRRLWMVSGRSWEEDPWDMAVPAVGKFFKPGESWSLEGIKVLRFESRREAGG